MEVKEFKLDYFINSGDKFHLAKITISSRNDLSLHIHNYYELFWIQEGSGLHHINGETLELNQGDLIMIRPSDRHTFSSTRGITLMNLAFSCETALFLRDRYFNDSQSYFWQQERLPYKTVLPLHHIKRLTSRAEQLLNFSRSDMELDSFLLFTFRILTQFEGDNIDGSVPLWLQSAIRDYSNPEQFVGGAVGFALLCHRGVDHVNRVVNRYFNISLTQLVNKIRMKYAAQQLILTDVPIKQLCVEVGFKNMGHFYRLFKEIYRSTPLQYRRVNQRIV